jgi:hypothetical protein
MKLNDAYMNGPSKILDRRWKEKEHAIHMKKLSQIKSTIRQQQVNKNLKPNVKNAKKEADQESKSEGRPGDNERLLVPRGPSSFNKWIYGFELWLLMILLFYSEVYGDREGEQDPPGENVEHYAEAAQHI